MAATALPETAKELVFPGGFQRGSLAEGDQRSGFHSAQLQPYQGDESFLASATERTNKIWDLLNELF